jgi:hypothetical protein
MGFFDSRFGGQIPAASLFHTQDYFFSGAEVQILRMDYTAQSAFFG